MGHRTGHTTRGIRNNNPGNIRHGGNAWYGLRAKQTDTEFVQFDDVKWGVRAVARTLLTYGRARRAKDGSPIDTLAEIITRWAPPRENDTKAYINSVSVATGFKPDQVIDLDDRVTLRQVTGAILRRETGQDPLSANELADAIDLAFLNAD